MKKGYPYLTAIIISLTLVITPSVGEEVVSKNITITYNDGIISITAKDAPLTETFTAITEKTGIKFIYNNDDISNKNITIELNEIPIQDAIKEILKTCDIKNYTTKFGGDPAKPIEQIEILTPPTATSSTTHIPYTEEEKPYYPETQEPEPIEYEEPIEDKGSEYRPPGYEPIPEEEIKTEHETEPQEVTEEETEEKPETIQFIKTRTYTKPQETVSPPSKPKEKTTIPTQIEDASDRYYPPGSEKTEEPSQPLIQEGETIPDMSEQYHPPGYK